MARQETHEPFGYKVLKMVSVGPLSQLPQRFYPVQEARRLAEQGNIDGTFALVERAIEGKKLSERNARILRAAALTYSATETNAAAAAELGIRQSIRDQLSETPLQPSDIILARILSNQDNSAIANLNATTMRNLRRAANQDLATTTAIWRGYANAFPGETYTDIRRASLRATKSPQGDSR